MSAIQRAHYMCCSTAKITEQIRPTCNIVEKELSTYSEPKDSIYNRNKF